MEPVAGILMGLAVADAASEEGEAEDHQQNGRTLDDPSAWVAHESSSFCRFSATPLAASACNASKASTRVDPHAPPAIPPLRPHPWPSSVWGSHPARYRGPGSSVCSWLFCVVLITATLVDGHLPALRKVLYACLDDKLADDLGMGLFEMVG
jgi:hypothetical protein